MTNYYKKHEKELQKLLDKYTDSLNIQQQELFEINNLIELLNEIETNSMKFKLRDYQKLGLYMSDILFKNIKNEVFHELFEEIEIGENNEKKLIPFATYEMATGSGKTLLMGAIMHFLNKLHNINNFLIITPPSKIEIYKKTIRNFTKGGKESIWAEDINLHFNIITGDDFYRQSLFFGKKDFNIFIFNIDKFRDGSTKVKKVNENAIWKDENENSISILDYIKSKKVVIFTDEAHHNQNKTGSLQIIKNFYPLYVLEFTATAKEESQKIIYKYNIKDLLEEKYCKIVRAFGVKNQSKSKELLSFNEKVKLFTILLTHLAKKYSLKFDEKTVNLKPLCFIKIKREIKEGKLIFEYIKGKLLSETKIYDFVLNAIDSENTEIGNIIIDVIKKEYKNDHVMIFKDLKKIIDNAIHYHSDSSKEIRKFYDTIDIYNNPCELILYHKILDEGIDLPNIYTIGIINDSNTNLLIPVKQIIGRGVRLNKLKREFDDSDNPYKIQTETLHIICDRDKNFEKVIIQIQKEFNVIDKYIGIDKERVLTINNTQYELLSDKRFPQLKASLVVKKDASLFELMSNTDRITKDYIKYNCFKRGKITLLKYVPESLFTEVDIFDDYKLMHEQIIKNGGIPQKLEITEKIVTTIINRIIKTIHCIPDIEKSRTIIRKIINRVNDLPLYYNYCDKDDLILVGNKFVETFCFFFRNFIEGNYFNLKYEKDENYEFEMLQNKFESYEFEKIIDDKTVDRYIDENNETKLKEVVNSGYYFKHFKHSYYDYVNYESYSEFKTAIILDGIIEKYGNKKDFWIRNQRNVFLEYGSHKYYPDFILFLGVKYYVIETKGIRFSKKLKNLLLYKLNDFEDYNGILLYDKVIDKIIKDKKYNIKAIISMTKSYEQELIRKNVEKNELILMELVYERNITKHSLFKKYLPVYSLKAAAGKFGQGEDVEELGWIEVRDMKLSKDMFIAQIKGNSMRKVIENGEYGIFKQIDGSPGQGEIVLVQHRGKSDSETGGSYSIKRYYKHKDKLEFKADTDNPHIAEATSFELAEPIDIESIQIIAEFVGKYDIGNNKVEK